MDSVLAIWNLACGLFSWYNIEDQASLANIYRRCEEKYATLNKFGFSDKAIAQTPFYYSLVSEKKAKKQHTDYEVSNYQLESQNIKEDITNLYNTVSVKDMLEDIRTNIKNSYLPYRMTIALNENIKNKVFIEEILSIVRALLFDYRWENHGFDEILHILAGTLGEDMLWILAEDIQGYLSNYDYDTSTENMHFLIKLAYTENIANELERTVISEINSQRLWITGNEHFEFCNHYSNDSCNLTTPTNSMELATNILLEQFDTRNSHRIEIAYPALYSLSLHYSNFFSYLHSIWYDLDDFQMENILVLCGRWAMENTFGFSNLLSLIYNDYHKSNHLREKYVLYLILENASMSNDKPFELMTYKEPSIEYCLDQSKADLLSWQVEKLPLGIQNFISLLGETDIFSAIDSYTSQETQKNTQYFRDIDSFLPEDAKDKFANKLLYGEEQKKRWSDVPLTHKMQLLLYNNDIWSLTTAPKISSAIVWDIEKNIEEMLKNHQYSGAKIHLEQILHSEVNETDIVIGGMLWFPSGQKNLLTLTMISKAIKSSRFLQNNDLLPCVMNYSLMANKADKVFPYNARENFEENGVSLFRKFAGVSSFYYGNTFLAPSLFIQDILRWRPMKNNPLILVKDDDNKCMRYEEITFPNRELRQQHYFRQPLLGRWLCDKKLLEETLESLGLELKQITKLENAYDI